MTELEIAVRNAMISALASDDFKQVIDSHCNERLAGLGIDWKSPEGMREFLEDQLYLRTWRKSMQKATRVTWVTALGIIVTGLVGMLWVGFQTLMIRP